MRFHRLLLALYVPAVLLMGALVVGMVLLAAHSLSTPSGWGWANYVEIFARPDYRATLGRTLWLALLTTLISIVVAYPLTRAIDRTGRMRTMLTVIVIVPWMVSIVVRSYGWVVLLGNRGTLNSFLLWTGISETPIQLLFNQIGVVIGLVHVFCPFMVISLLAVMQHVEPHFEEAAMSLGAGPVATFLRVTLPLTAPGLLSGSSIVFLLSSGAVLTPLLLGGPRAPMLAVQIYQDVFQLFNFSRASAMAFVLMAMAIAVILPIQWIERRLYRRLPSGDSP
jgi:putative spermidine/putrescine transport system permease protein